MCHEATIQEATIQEATIREAVIQEATVQESQDIFAHRRRRVLMPMQLELRRLPGVRQCGGQVLCLENRGSSSADRSDGCLGGGPRGGPYRGPTLGPYTGAI